MAKTRIKTTPTRMQKEALMASAAVTTTTNIVTEHVFKKRISVLRNSFTAKETTVPIQSTIIVQPPKRTNSISSTTSTISHTSDGTHSCADSPPPNISSATASNNGPTMDELTENAIKTLNAGLLAKSNALALKNRKVYMITEKCDNAANTGSVVGSGSLGANGAPTGQKRKMYLIMEEKESDKLLGGQPEKLLKAENTKNSKKLTLFTDTTSGQLPQKFEKILPEILNCIQAKKGGNTLQSGVGKMEILTPDLNGQHLKTSTPNKDANLKIQMKIENSERLPLTLPPKKNRTKIITTQIIPVDPNQQHAIYHNQANGTDNWSSAATGGTVISGITSPAFVTTAKISNGICKPENTIGATPVIVNASTLLATNGNSNIPANVLKNRDTANINNGSSKANVNQLHKNINLSTDFLFLMKMLPKLESIEEPHKNYVKTRIEDIINQYAPNQIEEQ